MNREQLTYFVEAAENLNFTDVAKRNYITQPAISKQISKLEEDLGVRLFLRLGHRVRLTAEGEFFLGEAKKILAGMHDAQRKTRLLGEGKTGQISIGAVSTSNYIISRCISAFSERHPGIMINVEINTASELASRLQSGEYDFVFTDAHMLPEDETISYTVSGHDRFCLVLPKKHPLRALPGAPEDSLAFLAEESFVIINMTDAPALHNMVLNICARRDYTPKIVNQYNRAEAVMISVGAGIGISIIPSVLARFYRIDGVKFFPLPGDDCKLPSVIIWKKQISSTAARLFLELILEYYPQPMQEKPASEGGPPHSA